MLAPNSDAEAAQLTFKHADINHLALINPNLLGTLSKI